MRTGTVVPGAAVLGSWLKPVVCLQFCMALLFADHVRGLPRVLLCLSL